MKIYSLLNDVGELQNRMTLLNPEKLNILPARILKIYDVFTFSDLEQEVRITEQKNLPSIINVECKKILESMFEQEIYETGISNVSEKYFLEWYKQNPNEAMNSLAHVFWDNFELDGRKTNILIGVLHLLSHLDYKQVNPLGPLLAISGTNHKNNEVAEYALKCFENWDEVELIPKLEAMKFHSKWLQEYANEIISELKELKNVITC